MLKWFILPCKMPAPAAQLNQGITELSWFTFRIVIIPLIGKKTPFPLHPALGILRELLHLASSEVLNTVGHQPRIHCASAQERYDNKHFFPKLCIFLSVLSHLGLFFSTDHRL